MPTSLTPRASGGGPVARPFCVPGLARPWWRGKRRFAGRPTVGRRNHHANKFFDVAQERSLFCVTERYRDTSRARSRRAANSVYVGLRNIWQIEIYDMADAVNIDATSGNIRCD